MSFIESRPLDDFMALGSSGGPEYQTDIIELSSGIEQRNQSWSFPRHRYLVGIAVDYSSKIETLRQLIHTTRGAFNGFRFRDFNDYSSAADPADDYLFTDQSLGNGDDATLIYQIFKNYVTGSITATRNLTKLVSSKFLFGFTGSGWTQQDTGARWTLDADTGLVTFDADTQVTITAASDQGSGVTRVTATAHGLGSGASGTIYLSTFTGDWAGLNNRRVNIISAATNTIDFTFDSSSYAAYSGNGGQLNTIPQSGEEIVWGGEFDVPVRFASDGIQISQISPGIEQASIELIEIK